MAIGCSKVGLEVALAAAFSINRSDRVDELADTMACRLNPTRGDENGSRSKISAGFKNVSGTPDVAVQLIVKT